MYLYNIDVIIVVVPTTVPADDRSNRYPFGLGVASFESR